MHDVKIVVLMFLGCYALILAWWILRAVLRFAAWSVDRMLRPLELRLFQWLQDRATARMLGADIDVIRMRRKMDFEGHCVDCKD